MSRLLLDGKNINGKTVHPMPVLLKWVQWSSNPEEAIDLIINSAIEYTRDEFIALRNDINSIWYVEPEVLI